MEYNESPIEAQTPTMELLSEDEKAIIDDAPDLMLSWLFDNILTKGIPEWVTFIRIDKNTKEATTHKLEGTDKVLALFDYVDYLVANGYRKDPYE